MLAERFKCTQQVGHLKAEHRLPPADPAREARQITRLRELAETPNSIPLSPRSCSTSSSPRSSSTTRRSRAPEPTVAPARPGVRQRAHNGGAPRRTPAPGDSELPCAAHRGWQHGPMSVLTRDEAQTRARLLDVHRYTIDLDLTRGDEHFGSTHRHPLHRPRRTGGHLRRAEARRPAPVGLDGHDPLDPAEPRRRPPPAHRPRRRASTSCASRPDMRYSRTGEGMHRFTDPADGETYLYTQCCMADANASSPPSTSPTSRPSSTSAVTAPDALDRPRQRHRHPRRRPRRRPLEARPHPADQHLPGRARRGPLPLRTHRARAASPSALHVRRSLAPHLDADADELFDITRRCFDRYHEIFDEPYPFDSYDQAFVPEFNSGAMENPGLVTFRDEFIYRSAVTDTERQTRAMVIAHEMAHMWFGDLVTLRVVGRHLAQRVLRRVHGLPDPHRSHPLHRHLGRLRHPPQDAGATTPTSAPPPTPSPPPPNSSPTPPPPASTSTASPTPRAPPRCASSSPGSARRTSSRGSTTTSPGTASATPPSPTSSTPSPAPPTATSTPGPTPGCAPPEWTPSPPPSPRTAATGTWRSTTREPPNRPAAAPTASRSALYDHAPAAPAPTRAARARRDRTERHPPRSPPHLHRPPPRPAPPQRRRPHLRQGPPRPRLLEDRRTLPLRPPRHCRPRHPLERRPRHGPRRRPPGRRPTSTPPAPTSRTRPT